MAQYFDQVPSSCRHRNIIIKTTAKNCTCYIRNNDIICFANHITYFTFGLQENRNCFSKPHYPFLTQF